MALPCRSACLLILTLLLALPALANPLQEIEVGNAAQARGDYNQAAAIFTRLIDTGLFQGQPNNLSVIHYNRGNAYLRQGRYDLASMDYTKAIQYNPRNAGPHGNLAICLAQVGRLTEARDYARHAMNLDPNDPVFPRLLADIESMLVQGK